MVRERQERKRGERRRDVSMRIIVTVKVIRGEEGAYLTIQLKALYSSLIISWFLLKLIPSPLAIMTPTSAIYNMGIDHAMAVNGSSR